MAAGSVTFTPNTYAGEVLAGFMALSLLEGNTVDRGLITVIDNVKKRKVLRSIAKTTVFQDPTCSFNGAGNNLAVAEHYLDPVKYEVHEEMCFEDLRDSWDAAQLRPGSFNDTIPTTDLSDFWVARTMEEVKNMNDMLYWQGKVAGMGFSFTDPYPGLLAKFEAGSDVFKVAHGDSLTITGITQAAQAVVTVGSTSVLNLGDEITFLNVVGMTEINGLSGTIVALTATTFTVDIDSSGFSAYVSGGDAFYINRSNVIDVLTNITSLIPKALRLKADLKIYVPIHVLDAYKYAQAEVANGAGSYFVGDKSPDFLGRILEPMPYFNANTIVVARVSNLFLGVDLIGDGSSIRTTDLRDVTNDELVRLRMSMKSDVNYVFGSEILYYRPA